MKTSKFLEYNKQFQIAGFLDPKIGGPYGYICHLIPAGIGAHRYWQTVAHNIAFIAVRPDFETLNFNETNVWQLSDGFQELMHECKAEFTYRNYLSLCPQFTGDGHIYTLIGSELSYLDMETRTYSCWSAVDKETSIGGVLALISHFIDTWKLRYAAEWKLHYVLKTSWKAADPKRKSYEIFVPTQEWIKTHAQRAL